MLRMRILTGMILAASLSACATMPTGPSVMALPGTNKNFDRFRMDEAACRQFAYEQIGGKTAEEAGRNAAVTSAVVGTVIGAAAGAAIGSASGDMGAGAAIGGGTGLLLGSAYGTGYGPAVYREAQRRYDHAYLQCMYAMGHKIPVYGRFTESPARSSSGPPPDYQPPAGYPPPPPPLNER